MTTPTTPIMTAETETIPAGHADVREASIRALYVHGFPGGDLPTAVLEQDILSMLRGAILAERERAAKAALDCLERLSTIFEKDDHRRESDAMGVAAEVVLAAIRKPTP